MTTRITDKNITSTGVAAGTYTNATVAVNAQGQITSASSGSSGSGGPKITTITVTDSSYNNLDDTAVDIAGGYIKIAGSGFASGCLVYLNQTPANSVSFVSSSELRVSVPALAAGTYIVYVINTDGGVAISVPGVTFSASPAWQTASALSDQYDNTAITLNLVAADATSYTLTSGSLPPGLTLNTSTGAITGTVTTVTVDTSYTFTVRATDAQLQDSPRTFTVTITISDPYFKLTTLLLGSEQGNTVIKDSSTNNFNLTAFGDSRASNFTPYGTGWSMQFDGTGDYLSVAANVAFDLGSTDFTVEAWAYFTSFTSTNGNVVISKGAVNSVGADFFSLQANPSGQIQFYFGNSSALLGGSTLSANTWYHLAVTRSGNTFALWVNGNSSTTTTSSATLSSGGPCIIGSQSYNPGASDRSIYGYISNVRIVKGVAVYTGAFTPPTQPLAVTQSSGTNISVITGTQTSLLTCQSNRFVDNSTNNFAITRNGDVAVRSFNPFGITNTGVAGSMYFDGSGDYVQANGANLAVGTGDFTLECYVYTWVFSGDPGIMQIGPSAYAVNTPAYTNSIGMSVTLGGNIFFYNNGSYTTGNVPIKAYTWNHLAICRSGTTHRLFVNGVQAASVTDSSNYTGQFFGAGVGYGTNFPFTGYITNVRLLRGTALYTAAFTPPAAPLTAIANTQLLTLQYDQPHNNHTFLDSSSNQFLITRSGNATQGTFSPFSQAGWSNYFDGTGDYLTLSDNAAFAFGSGAVTIETWAYFNTSISSFVTLLAQSDNASAAGSSFIFVVDTTGKVNFEFYYGSSTITLADPDTVPINQWVHLAVSRNTSNTISLYINGIRKATNTSFSASVNDSSQTVSLGGRNTGIQPLNGYLSNSRIVKGTAVYDPTLATLSVPTTPLTAITNTSLLTCHANRFMDASTNNFAITRNGNTSVVAFSPFNPTSVWSASTVGGSGYFDGNGDYLTTPNVTALNLYNVTNTVECWVYPLSFSTQFQLYGTDFDGTYYTLFEILDTSGYPRYMSRNGTAITGSSGITLNQWNHVAFGRSGSTQSIWVNGIRVASGTITTEDQWGTAVITIGRFNAASRGNGYLSSLRVVKGTDVYGVSNTTITVPTAPVTATTNTSLLLNFTDAAILDSTGRNVVETAADAKSSSVITKFTGGSMYFDGTGDRLVLPASPNLTFGTSDFTIEMWINSAAQASNSARIMGNGAGGSWGANKWIFTSTTAGNPNKYTFQFWNYNSGGADLLVSSSTANNSSWTHVAITRSGSTFRMFVNGTLEATQTSANSLDGSSSVYLEIGRSGLTGEDWAGYIQDLRITQGYARYTQNFTPPTAAHRLK